ncbi:MAG: sulfate adenylyltransferase subunit 1, partial [Mycobacteriales bacterium]
RKFIIADTPGHVQYTSNMVTGASTADVAIVLVDARHGLVEQTRRHTAIAALLRVGHVVLAVNKMDLMEFSEPVYDRIVAEFDVLAAKLDITSTAAIPLSALHGDNVVTRSENMPWYAGSTLLDHIETTPVRIRQVTVGARMPVQTVIRPRSADYPDYRAYSGRVAAGTLTVGDEVVVLPSGTRSRIAGIDTYDGELLRAPVGRSVAVRLADNVDVSRGDLLASAVDVPQLRRELRGRVCVVTDRVIRPGDRFGVRLGTREVRGSVIGLGERWDAATLLSSEAEHLFENDIGTLELLLSEPVSVDRYKASPTTGSFLLTDEATGATVAAGMVL